MADPWRVGPTEELATACRQLAAHFHCSPYEFFDKPGSEIWSIYDGVSKDLEKLKRNREDG